MAERAAVIDGGVAVGVEDDVVVLAGNGRHQAQVRLVAGRKDHGMAGAVEFLQRLFALLLALIGAGEDAAPGRARSKLRQRLLAGREHLGIEGNPRSEERRVGKEWVWPCRSHMPPDQYKKKQTIILTTQHTRKS